MNGRERAETIARYSSRLATFGPTEKALGWGDKGRSRIRYEILLSRWSVQGATVLDFGCGFGDLFAYINAKGLKEFRYVGVDINPELLAVARRRYPNATFLLDDEVPVDAEFDYVFSSGVFNYRLEDSRSFITCTLDRFDRWARKGYCANFLSNRVEYELAHTYHADPCDILSMAYAHSNNVVLRNDYMPYEFTIFVTKDVPVDKRLTVYEEFVKYE